MDREVFITLAYAGLLTAIAWGLTAWAGRIDARARESPHTWVQSEEAQLRRGVALVAVFLAALLLTLQMVRHPRATEVRGLVIALIVDLICGWRVLKRCWQ